MRSTAPDELSTTRRTKTLNHPAATPGAVYDYRFAAAYFSNTTLLIAVALLFRFSDFVKALGGNEAQLGWITGIGTSGAIVMRLIQGSAIDRFGARGIWFLAMCGYTLSIALHLLITSIAPPWIYLANLAMAGSLSGAFGASITFVSLRAPAGRVTEVIGTLGSSGFLGMAIGPALGDWIYGWDSAQALTDDPQVRLSAVRRLFVASTCFAAISWASAILATWGVVAKPRVARRRPPSWWILRRYQPGTLLAVAVAMGAGIGLLQVYVRPFAETMQIENLRVFFLTYALTAFTVRMATRTWPARFGEFRMILVGLSTLALSMFVFLTVSSEWMLIGPAVVAGIAHALLFPAVVASGCAAFPTRYRGLATTLVLASFDLGNLIGRPLCGQIVTRFGQPDASLGYAVMFTTMATLLVIVATCYAWLPRARLRWSAARPN